MTVPQSKRSPPRGGHRAVAVSVWSAAALLGAGALVRPFVESAEPWRWVIQSADDIHAATVNAEIVGIGDGGVRLAPQGERPISIVSPPLAIPERAPAIVEIRLGLPDVAPGEQVETALNLLWQTESAPAFHYETRTVALGAAPRAVRFNLPVRPGALHRIGVQLPGVRTVAVVQSMETPDLSAGERVAAVADALVEREPIDNARINFLQGPVLFERRLNYYLVALAVALIGAYGLVQTIRSRRPSRGVFAGIILAVWLAADARATANLARQFRDEYAALAGLSWPEQIAAIYGDDVAWAYSQLQARTPPGSTFAVVSDREETPAHRLGYLAAPIRTRRDAIDRAEYVVVLGATECGFVSDDRWAARRGGAAIPVERVAAMSDRVYLLRRRPE